MLAVFVNPLAAVRGVLHADVHPVVNTAVVKSVLFAVNLRTVLLKR
jgi:hypothetical protein